ncbi:PAS domain S-box protein [Fimbriimonas ginsengisoli]|uniref:histidine kinase n=1 Tax=Fimbriimonas ginsengisoli Gsoil 348 TaxID=661478 RepID=A0A068NYD0_FIMGI|nr:PAS domain S-box protein [Fimbriimonas ginsengisoli]AIE88025.1 multi-sensor hybrid histidine kinase [Fimbriimonas ginsengisoli Gsoil 348]
MPTSSSTNTSEKLGASGDRDIEALHRRIDELQRQVNTLSESEGRYRTLVERSSEGIWRAECEIPIALTIPVEHQIEIALKSVYLAECNDAMARMYGLDRASDLVGTRLDQMFDRTKPETHLFLSAFLKNLALNDVESEEVGVDGQPRWFLNSLFGIVERGCLVRAWGSQRDITSQKRDQRELDFQRQFLRNVIESIPSVVFVKDSEGRYVLGNAATARLYGTDVSTLEGRFDIDFRAASETEEFLTVDRKVLETSEDVGPYEMRIEGADGKVHWFEATKHPIPSVEPGKSLVLGVCTDITERKNSEIELLKIRHALHSAGDAITITDLEGKTSYVNPAFERMFGYTADELNAAGGTIALYPEGDNLEMIYRSMNDRYFFEGEVTLRHRNGSPRLVHQRVDIILSSDGARVGVLGVRTDIGERKRLESQIRQTEKLAALGELVAGVAHEINNPLAAISVNAQILKRVSDSGVQKRAETILRMVDRATRIGKSLLAFSRESQPRQKAQPINDVLNTAIELCESSVRRENVLLEVALCEENPIVYVDESQIEQVVLNLVSNALHAMRGSGRGQLKLRTTRERDWAVISIDDQGLGIPNEHQNRVFEPFFTTKPVGEGTGLGLSICHGIAEAHRGSLSFESRPGEGTTFNLRLPLRVDD